MCAQIPRNAFLSYQNADSAQFTAHILSNIFIICAPPHLLFFPKPQAGGGCRLAEGVPDWAKGKCRPDSPKDPVGACL